MSRLHAQFTNHQLQDWVLGHILDKPGTEWTFQGLEARIGQNGSSLFLFGYFIFYTSMHILHKCKQRAWLLFVIGFLVCTHIPSFRNIFTNCKWFDKASRNMRNEMHVIYISYHDQYNCNCSYYHTLRICTADPLFTNSVCFLVPIKVNPGPGSILSWGPCKRSHQYQNTVWLFVFSMHKLFWLWI